MRSAIYDILFYKHANIDTIKESEEYKKAGKRYDDTYEKLLTTLNEEQKEISDKLFYCMWELVIEAQATFYEEGFKMAVKLLTDGLK